MNLALKLHGMLLYECNALAEVTVWVLTVYILRIKIRFYLAETKKIYVFVERTHYRVVTYLTLPLFDHLFPLCIGKLMVYPFGDGHGILLFTELHIARYLLSGILRNQYKVWSQLKSIFVRFWQSIESIILESSRKNYHNRFIASFRRMINWL